MPYVTPGQVRKLLETLPGLDAPAMTITGTGYAPHTATPYHATNTTLIDLKIDLQLAVKKLPARQQATITARVIRHETPTSLAKRYGGTPSKWARALPVTDIITGCKTIADILNGQTKQCRDHHAVQKK